MAWIKVISLLIIVACVVSVTASEYPGQMAGPFFIGSRLLVGNADPDTGFGLAGDWFLNNVSYDVWNRTATAWVWIGNLQGINGTPGSPGADGAANMTAGPQGPAGATGATGPTGPMNLTFNLTANMTAGPAGPPGTGNFDASIINNLTIADQHIAENLTKSITEARTNDTAYQASTLSTVAGWISGNRTAEIGNTSTWLNTKETIANTSTQLNLKDTISNVSTNLNLKETIANTSTNLNLKDTIANVSLKDTIANVSTNLNTKDTIANVSTNLNLKETIANTSTQLGLKDTIANVSTNLNTKDTISNISTNLNLKDTIANVSAHKVEGAASVTDAMITVFSGTTGKLIAASTYTVQSLIDAITLTYTNMMAVNRSQIISAGDLNLTKGGNNTWLNAYKGSRANISISASSCWATLTNSSTETAPNRTPFANLLEIITIDFPKATTTYGFAAQCAAFRVPGDFTGTTFVPTITWTPLRGGAPTQVVNWSVDLICQVDDGGLSIPWGNVTMTDAMTSQNYLNVITGGALTPGGTVSPGGTCFPMVRRINGDLVSAAGFVRLDLGYTSTS